jgi:hypothetical protein
MTRPAHGCDAVRFVKTWLLLPLLSSAACRADCEGGQESAHGWCLGPRITQNSGGVSGTADGSGGLDASSGAGGAGDSGVGGSGPADADAPDCGADAVASGRECLPRELFVDCYAGDDDAGNPGTFEHPFKSFRRAMLAAQDGQIVNFNTGIYGEPTEDDFREQIPDGVALRKLRNSERVVFKAMGNTSSLIFAGSGRLSDINLEGFQDPIKATAGRQFLVNVSVYSSKGTIVLARDAEMDCDGCSFYGNPQRGPLLKLEGAAKLHWNVGAVVNDREDCTEDAGAGIPHAITLHDSASLFATQLSIWGRFGAGIYHDGSGTIQLTRAAIGPGCFNSGLIANPPFSHQQRARLSFEDRSVFYGSVTVDARGVRARNSFFLGRHGLTLAGRRNGIDDLGNELDPGRNTFSNLFEDFMTDQEVGLIVMSGAGDPDGGNGTVDVIEARGNTWVGGAQGAEPDGTYREHYVIRGRSDRNVWAPNSEVRVGRVSQVQP